MKMDIFTKFKCSIVILIYLINQSFLNKVNCENNSTRLNDIESKIIGGYPVKVKSFPFAVMFFNLGSICSGTILNSYSILTAAHCFDNNQNESNMLIQIGEYIQDANAETFDVLSFVIHESYNEIIQFQADIGLVFIKEPIRFKNKSKKAILVDNNRWMKSKNKDIIAIGWGWTKVGGPLSESGLRRTNLQFINKRKCEKLHNITLTDDMFCLYGDGARDTCKGDSGGAVIWNDTVIGIVSHGDGCAKKDKPSMYISVYYHRKWIRRNVMSFFHNYCELLEEQDST